MCMMCNGRKWKSSGDSLKFHDDKTGFVLDYVRMRINRGWRGRVEGTKYEAEKFGLVSGPIENTDVSV